MTLYIKEITSHIENTIYFKVITIDFNVEEILMIFTDIHIPIE